MDHTEDMMDQGVSGALPPAAGLSPSVEPVPVSPPDGASIPNAVTQADRDAAADWATSVMIFTKAERDAMREGLVDQATLVRAFARHRTTSQANLIEALQLADALLRGANMNRALAEKKITAALTEAEGRS